jgi:hypothetical protein
MKKYSLLFLTLVFFYCQEKNDGQSISKDLTSDWDTITPLANPHKGWYHHLLDNGVNKYAIQDKNLLEQFPGMDHMYLRLAWSYLEPKEGVFDWSRIDEVIEEYVPKGYGISFRISCKETGRYPNSVGQEFEGVQYATPKWVKDAGAKGTVVEARGTKSWTPVWDDPVFLEKLDNFHKAFAERYDERPYVRYTDVGSIGDWGEGHTSSSTNVPPTVAEVKANMDLHHRHYKNTLVVVTDDLLYFGKSKEDANELLNYALSLGFTLRDDSPLVDWYVDTYGETFSVSHPHFFEKSYPFAPIIYELQHYGSVKRDGNWLGENGEEKIPNKDFSGADLFRESLKILRATYIGYHGYLEEWYNDNPKLTGELLNMCGYWFFPKSVDYPELVNGNSLNFSINWVNKGVAPAYNKYLLWVKLEGKQDSYQLLAEDSDPLKWFPATTVQETYKLDLPVDLISGDYKVKIKLTTTDKDNKKDVLLGLSNELRDTDGYYDLFSLTINGKGTTKSLSAFINKNLKQ